MVDILNLNRNKFFKMFPILTLFPLIVSTANAQENPEKVPVAEGFVETFDEAGYKDRWWFGNFDFGGDGMITGWRRHRAWMEVPVSNQITDGANGGFLVLSFGPAPAGEEKAYWGAETQRQFLHHFGDYEVRMKAAKGDGLVSSFFTYTGPYFGDPHDEIDVEILGKDTTKLHINAFASGHAAPNRSMPLGFDSADDYHIYRFEWREDSITWFVDGMEFYHLDAQQATIPQIPGKLMASLWGVAKPQEAWAGKVAEGTEARALYDCMSYRPLGDDGPECHDIRGGE